jgi:hypothetical protein
MYVPYPNAEKVPTAFIIGLTAAIMIIYIIRTVTKGTYSSFLLKAGDKIEERIKRFDNSGLI